MKAKIIPFPSSEPRVSLEQAGSSQRVIVRIGGQSYAFDISCRAALLPGPGGPPKAEADASAMEDEREKA